MIVKPLGAMLLHAVAATGSALAALWTFPSMLLSAFLVAWGAEAAQFLIAQGLALAALAWLQTLPEFAVEAVIAWRAGREPATAHLAIANLTGAIRLLVGLAWPMIFFVAAFFGRRTRGGLPEIVLDREHAVEVMGLLPPLAYFIVIWAKGSISWVDAAVLLFLYAAYLWVLWQCPPRQEEELAEAPAVSRWAYNLGGRRRVAAIVGLFAAGGALLYLTAEPFLESMLAVAAVLGVSDFVLVQWVAPFLSEFPEKISAFNWARRVKHAPMALMNMVSSNINQWTLLAAMLPIVYSISRGAVSPIPFDDEQKLEVLMTLGQSLVSILFLVNMKLTWWEAGSLFSLWFIQFAFSPFKPGPGFVGYMAGHIHWIVTALYFLWFAVGLARYARGGRRPEAFLLFAALWRQHIRPPGNTAVR